MKYKITVWRLDIEETYLVHAFSEEEAVGPILEYTLRRHIYDFIKNGKFYSKRRGKNEYKIDSATISDIECEVVLVPEDKMEVSQLLREVDVHFMRNHPGHVFHMIPRPLAGTIICGICGELLYRERSNNEPNSNS